MARALGGMGLTRFQSPRGDFGFLKRARNDPGDASLLWVSIPSRGFWFFEGNICGDWSVVTIDVWFQSPRGDFGFLKSISSPARAACSISVFQSPRGDFGFLKPIPSLPFRLEANVSFNPLAGILVF